MNSPQLSVAQVYDGDGEALLTLTGVVDRADVARIEARLGRLLARGASSVLVDLSAVWRCDCRLLAALERVHQRLQPAHGQLLHTRGLDPATLTGFDDAGLPTVLAAYRASLAQLPQPDGTRGRCTPAERHLALVCTELGDPLGVDFTEDALAARLVSHCVARLAIASATVLLADQHGSLRVAAASNQIARALEWSATVIGQGPGADSYHSGEPVYALSLAQKARQTRWPLFVAHAAQQRIGAVFAVPLRHRNTTIGVVDLYTARPGPIAATDLDVVAALATLVTITILSARRTHTPATTTPRPPRAPARVGTDRIMIDQATGVLAEREHLTLTAAATRLAESAHTQHRPLTDIARDTIAATLTTAATHTAQPSACLADVHGGK
jgi:anti-anti-sigma regulatory factor